MSLDLDTRPGEVGSGEQWNPQGFVDTASLVQFEDDNHNVATLITTETRRGGEDGITLKLDQSRPGSTEDTIGLHRGMTIIVAQPGLTEVQVVTIEQLPHGKWLKWQPGKLAVTKITNLGKGDAETAETTEYEFKRSTELSLDVPADGVVKTVRGDAYTEEDMQEKLNQVYGYGQRQQEFELVGKVLRATASLPFDDFN